MLNSFLKVIIMEGDVFRGFIKFEKKSYLEFGRIKEFCFKNNLLKKVTVEIVQNKSDFLKNEQPITKDVIFESPFIPHIFKMNVTAMMIDKSKYQCE